MTLHPAAVMLVFVSTTALTMAGIGADIVIIPTLYWFGVPLEDAIVLALLLNALSMTLASANNIRHRLVDFSRAIPIIIAATVACPVGVYFSRYASRETLLGLLAGFLVFAAFVMWFYRPRVRSVRSSSTFGQVTLGLGLGLLVGSVAGLLGVGGGSFIVPVLIWLGLDPRRASGTTAFIVLFSSLVGFVGRAGLDRLDVGVLAPAAAAAAAGAILGSSLVDGRMKSEQVRVTVGIVLCAVATQILLEPVF